MTVLEDDEDLDALTFHLVGLANRSCFRYCRMAHQTGLDLHGTETVAAHLDHVIDTPLHTEVAITIFGGGIACEVDALNRIPIGLVAGGITIDRTHQRWPGLPDD